MFLVAITTHRLGKAPGHLRVHQVELDRGRLATIWTDDVLSTFSITSTGFLVREALRQCTEAVGDVYFVQLIYKSREKQIEIFKPIRSGKFTYYHASEKGEFFCATHVSILRMAGVPIEENLEALPEFFIYRYIMPPRTLYKEVRQVGAGDRVTVELNNQGAVPLRVQHRHPAIPIGGGIQETEQEIAMQVLERLNLAVKQLEPSKDRIALLLSGGLDSSILFKLCQNILGVNTTYATGYPFEPQESNLEWQYAATAAEAFNSTHTYCDVSANEYLSAFIEAISVAEEPLHHLQSVLLYEVWKSRLPENKDVVIVGQGADGLFGINLQYSLRRHDRKIFRVLAGHPLSSVVDVVTRGIGRRESWKNVCRTIEALKVPLDDPHHLIWKLGAFGSEQWVINYFNVRREEIVRGRWNYVKLFHERSIYDLLSILDFFGDVATTEAIWWKLGENARRVIIYPYNDDDLVSYTYAVPWCIKLKEPKNILRIAARRLGVPEFIIRRRKSGFGCSAEHWAKRGGVFEALVPLASRVFEISEIRRMQEEEEEKASTYWNMLNYAIWKRLMIKGDSPQALLGELRESLVQQGLRENVKDPLSAKA